MDNLEKLIKGAKPNKYSNKEKNRILKELATSEGDVLPLIKAVEELAELINVTCENVYKKVNRLHTAEEISDVRIFVRDIKRTAGIKDSDLKKCHIPKKIKTKHVIKALADLSKAQQLMTKCIRAQSLNKKEGVAIVNTINHSVAVIEGKYRVKKSELGKIESLKYDRCQERSKNPDNKRLQWTIV